MQVLSLEKASTKEFSLLFLASCIIALAGQIAIPLWFTPIPMTTQNSMVLLMAALLGSRKGFLATLAFLSYGAMGLPVFSNGFAGIACMMGPRGGYLLGFLIASFVVGYMVERQKGLAKSLLIGHGIILLCGASYLSYFVGASKAFLLGVAPFMVGDLIKTALIVKFIQWTSFRSSEY